MTDEVDESERKAELQRYLQAARDALLTKLEGLSEYDLRRPMTSTGTNLLGLVKHVASVELGYFAEVFDRPSSIATPWLDEGAEPNADFWATADQSSEWVVDLYHRVWANSDATIEALPLDAAGEVPWWPVERRRVTLNRMLAHLIAETNRHAGHADILRELIDGSVGMRRAADNIPDVDEAWWTAYREQLEAVARQMSPDRSGRMGP